MGPSAKMETKFIAHLLVLFGGVAYAASGFMVLVTSVVAASIGYLPLNAFAGVLFARLSSVALAWLAAFSVIQIISSYVIIRHSKAMSKANAVFSKSALSLVIGAAFVGLAGALLVTEYNGLTQSSIINYFAVSAAQGIVPYAFVAIVSGTYAYAWSDRAPEGATVS